MGSGRRKRQKVVKESTAVKSEEMMGAPEYIQSLIDFAYDDAIDTNMTREEIMQRAGAVRHLPPCHPTATKAADAYK